MESGRKDGLAEEEEEAEKQATQPKLQLKCCANNFERQFVTRSENWMQKALRHIADVASFRLPAWRSPSQFGMGSNVPQSRCRPGYFRRL